MSESLETPVLSDNTDAIEVLKYALYRLHCRDNLVSEERYQSAVDLLETL